MPQAVVAVISAVATVGFTTAAAAGISITAMATATAFAIGAGVIAVGALAANKLISSMYEIPKMDTDASRQRTVRSTIEPQKIIYGEALVSGPIAFVGVYGSKNRVLAHAVALAGHEVNAITDIHFDNEVIDNSLIDGNGFVTSGTFGPVGNNQFNDQGGVNFGFNICKINKHLGAAGQTVDADLDSAFGSIDSSHKGTGIAYITTHWLLKDDSQEIWDKYTPTNIKALVEGRKVYDPRTDLTAYSDNPALCVADYLTNAEFGMGISSSRIDWNSVTAAANACDVLVDTPDGTDSQKRFTCNGILFATDTHKTNINKLLSSMNGLLTYTNGTFVIRAGVYEAPTVSLNENDLIGGVSVKTSVERSDRFNTITGTFIDPTQNHKATEFPEVYTTAARDRDSGNVLTKNIQLPMTNDRYMAQRIAHKLVQQSDQQKVVTFPTNLSGMDVAVGDRVEISLSEFGWVDKVFICLGWTLNDSGNGGINLILREDDAGSYADPAVGEYSTITATGQIVEGFRGVPDPQNLIATSFNNYIQLNWTNPDNMNDVLFIEVFASPVSAWSETFTATSGQTVFVYDRDFTVDDTFDVKLDGVALVQGTDFTVDLETKTLTLTTGATAGDILEIFNRIKIGETDGTQFVHDAATPADSISPDDTRYYWIRARAYSTGETALSVSDRNPDNDVSTVFATVGRVDFLNVSGDVVQTGDTSRTLIDRLSDIISPDDFGAVGDGIEDDTAALKALAAWIYSISTDLDTGYRKGHVSIRFPARRLYKITDTIDFGGEAKDDGSGAVQTGLRVHFDFNNCEIAPAPHPDTGVVSSALRMWGDNSSWKNLKVNYARYCTKDEVYADQPTGVYVGPDPADMSTRFASNSFATYENIQVFDAYNGFELEPDTIALFKVTWRQCDAKGCMNWGFLMDSQPIIGASTTNTFQQCHVAAKLASDTSRVYIDEPSTATSGQTVISYTQDFTNVDEPIVQINSTYLDRSIFAQYLIVGETYIIINLGDADWNTIAGTTGVTYSIGDVITVAVAGAAGSTGRAGDYTVDLDTSTITLAVGLTTGDEIHVYGVYDPIQTHVPGAANKPGYGADWTDYWFRLNNADTVSSVREEWSLSTNRYYEDGKGWYLYGFGSTGFIGQCAVDGTNNRVAGNTITCLQFGLTISGGFHWEVAKFVSDGIPSILMQNASLHIDHLYMPEPYFVNDGVNTVIGGSNSRLCHVEEVRVVAANMSRGTRAIVDAAGFGVVHTGVGVAEDEVVNSPSSNVHGAYDVQRKVTARSMFRELGQDFGGSNSTVTPATWQSGTTFVHNVPSSGSFTLNLTKDPERGSEYRAFCYNSAGGATANVTASSTDGATIIGPTVAKGGETLVAYKTGNSFWHTRIEYTQNFGSGDPSVGDVKPVDLTVAELPSAATYEGYVVRVTDDSSYGEVLVYSDGTNWVRVNDLNPADSTGVTYVDTTNGRLGVNNSAPVNQLSVGAIEASSGDQLGTVGIKSDANDKALMLQENVGTEQWEIGVDADGDLNFYNSGSTTPSVQFLDAGGIDVTGEITADGIALGDNQKATFGASDDLQIYHDGTNSYIQDLGTGDLNLLGSNLALKSGSGAITYASASASTTAITLNYGGSAKLATTATGIDVTGTVTADKVGITEGELEGNSGNLQLQSLSTGIIYDAANGYHTFRRNGTNAVQINGATGDISFYEDTGTTAKLFWDASAEYLGLGTTSPSVPFHVSTASDVPALFASTDSNSQVAIADSLGSVSLKNVAGRLDVTVDGDAGTWTNQKVQLRVNNGGDVSFFEDTGTTAKLTWSAANETLTIDNANTAYGLDVTGSSNTDRGVRIKNNTTGTFARTNLRLESAGGTGSNLLYTDPAYTGVSGWANKLIIGTDGASNGILLRGAEIRLTGDLSLNDPDLVVTDAGNIGINTASPQALLDVNGGDARINSYALGRGSGGSSTNTVFGLEALDNNTTGTQSVAIGKEALRYNTTGYVNTAVGSESLKNNTTGQLNTASGAYSLRYNTTGFGNTSFGYAALQNNIYGNYNTAVGDRASNSNTSGVYNVAVGRYALNENTTGGYNVAIGSFSLQKNNANYNTAVGYGALLENTTGSQNTALGMYSLYFTTSGAYNTATGMYAGYLNTTGNYNVFNGRQAGNNNTTGSFNTLIGYTAGDSLTTGSNNTIIGAIGGTAGLSNTIIIGAGATERIRCDSSGNFGLNYSTPLATMHVRSLSAGQTTANLTDAGSNHGLLRISDQGSAAGAGGGIVFANSQGDTASSKGFAAIKGFLTNGANNTQGDLAIALRSTSTDTALSEVARFTSSGRLGINTTSPATELSVSGTIRALTSTNYTDVKDYGIEINRANGYLWPTSAFNGSANLNIGASGSLWNVVSIASDNSFQITDGTDKRFEVQAGADAIFYDDVGVEGMRWDSSAQRLGIGVSSPTEKLDVNGTVKATDIQIPYAAATMRTYSYGYEIAVNTTGGWARAYRLKNDYDGRLYAFGARDSYAYIATNYGTGTDTGYAEADNFRVYDNGNLAIGATPFLDASLNLLNINNLNGGTPWTSANDGSGSGLDADLLDGVHGSSFLRSDAADQATQRIQFTANATNGWNTIATGSGSQGCIEVYNGGAGNDAFMSFHVGGDFACYFGLDGGINDLAVGGWSFGANSYRIWHQGNDGAGSGLDADLLDGLNSAENGSSVILKTASNGYLNIDNWIRVGATTGLYNSTGHYIYPDAVYGWRLRNGGSTTTASISLDNSAGSRVGWVYANDTGQGFLTTGGSWRFRIPASGSLQRDATYTIWDSGNDGAGSGLDADTLDGIQGSNFLRSDTSDTMNGNLTVTNDLTAGESFFGATSYKVRINSTSTTGILEFNSTNGVIRNTGTVLGLAANSTQIVDVRASAMQPTTDNVTDLGASTKRWDNIYATNALIQTSDGAEKQDVEALSDAELRVAQSIKGLIRKFRFKSAVAEKGDDARIHFGVIAQDVRAAFEAEGLDATRYGCFCADVDEDGNERLGIRYDELLAFVITAL